MNTATPCESLVFVAIQFIFRLARGERSLCPVGWNDKFKIYNNNNIKLNRDLN